MEEAFDTIRSLSDINETVKKYVETVPSLVDAHARFGQSLSLSGLGDTAASLTNVYTKSKKWFPHAMVWRIQMQLSDVRLSVWYNSICYCGGLPAQCPKWPLSILCLEQLFAAKTSRNRPVSCKIYRMSL